MRCRRSLFVSMFLSTLLAACGGKESGSEEVGGRIAATAEPGVVRALFLTGGGYHEFEVVPRTLMEGLAEQDGIEVRLLPIDDEGIASHELSDTALLDGEIDVILAYTQGNLALSPAARDKLMAAIEGGVGYVGLHCAGDSYPGWADYDRMLGGRFERHPPLGPIVVTVDNAEHAVTAGLPAEWSLIDEFYHLQGYSPVGKDVLMTGVSPDGGARRPVTWAKTHGKGRVVYTILGHTRDVHADARFRQLVGQALRWAAAQPQAGD